MKPRIYSLRTRRIQHRDDGRNDRGRDERLGHARARRRGLAKLAAVGPLALGGEPLRRAERGRTDESSNGEKSRSRSASRDSSDSK